MKSLLKKAIAGLSILLVVGTPCYSQFSAQLTFEFVPGAGAEPDQYSWQGDIAITTTSPGGTVVENLERATFSSFDAMLDDIIGEWEMTSIDGATVTFSLSSFDQANFPEFQLVAPVDGQAFSTGSIIGTEIAPNLDEFIGQSLNLISDDNVEIEFLSDFAFQPSLVAGAEIAMMSVARRAGIFEQGLLAGFQGDVLLLSVSPDVLIQSFSSRANILIVPFLLGDINGDGVVDLLDIAPFVDLVVRSGFQNEADINQDGSVDLLDVVPFVDLVVS